MRRPLLVLDGDALMHRVYHALPPVRGTGGRPVNALLGFANLLTTYVDDLGPRAVAVGLDSREPSYRTALYPGYQAQRDPFEPAIVEQLDELQTFMAAFAVPVVRIAAFEADDVCATLVRREEAAGGSCQVVTHDRDAFQLVSERTVVLRPGGREGLELVDRAGVVARYGVLPEQVPDLIALRGDPSDNLPGARGIGQKGAAELLQRYGDLEGVIEHADELSPGRRAAIVDAAPLLRDFRAIATMRGDLAVEPPPDGLPDWAGGAAEARRRGITRLAERLASRA